jgi:Fe-S-cluster containining protein
MPRLFKLDLVTQHGALKGSLPLPDAPIRLAEFAFQIYPLDQKLVQMAVEDETRDGKKAISCKAGCGACCKQAVPVSIPEAFLLRDLVLSFPQEKRIQVLQRFEGIQKKLVEHAGELDAKADEDWNDKLRRIGIRYFEFGLDCPFLENQSCSIHPYRPTVCREFLVTSPAEACATLISPEITGVPMAINMPHCMAKLTGILFDREPELIPMPLALDWAENHPEWNTQRFDAGLLYSTLFDIMRANSAEGNSESP